MVGFGSTQLEPTDASIGEGLNRVGELGEGGGGWGSSEGGRGGEAGRGRGAGGGGGGGTKNRIKKERQENIIATKFF